MAKRTKFTAVDSRGVEHTRTSESRTYTHCVVIRLNAVPASEHFTGCPAYTKTEWAGSAALAQKNAARWRGPRVEGVEVIPVAEAL